MNQNNDNEYRLSYAQNREDILLGGFFEGIEKGFYVDIGANHPTFDSVTKTFYDRGWSGINIEPIVSLFKLLSLARARDININSGVARESGKKFFREYTSGSGLSTFSKKLQDEYKAEKTFGSEKYKEHEVEVHRLDDIFKENHVTTIHFMKIDVEGFEDEVISSNNWHLYRPWVLCIEANHGVEWSKVLERNNYIYAFSDGINQYYVAHEHANLLENFSYAQTILSRPIVSVALKQLLDKEVTQLHIVENKLKRIESENQFLKSELNRLHHVIAQSQGFKQSIKLVLRSFDRAMNVYIEKLNKPKIYKPTGQHLSLETKKPQNAIKQIRAYDFNNFYTKKSSESITYKLVHTVYIKGTRVPFRAIKKMRLRMRNRR